MSSREVDLIKARLPIAEFLRSYITLTPAGKSFKAPCPFHQEKTPSFMVSPERSRWHCFGCGEDGDIVTFVMKYENLEFSEALHFLAERAGIELVTTNARDQREFGVLYDLHDAAKEFFCTALTQSSVAQAYVQERGLCEETIRMFGLGFSPGGEALTLALLKQGYAMQDIVRAGLSQKAMSGMYRDRFYGRLIFPIMNHIGKTVAFAGRVIPALVPQGTDIPKYLNSPETPIYNKSKILYGLHASKQIIAQEKTVLLVEGYMDFLGVWQSGIHNVVAVSGTALTEHHLEKLRRSADTMILSFDNDDAGTKALERSLVTLGHFDFHVKVMDLGKFKDPADAAQNDPGYILHAQKNAQPAFTYLFDRAFLHREDMDIVQKKRITRHFLTLLRHIRSAVEQTEWIRALARYSGISESALLTEFNDFPQEKEEENISNEENLSFTRKERAHLIAERLVPLAFTHQDFLTILQENKAWLPSAYQGLIDRPESDAAALFVMQGQHLASEIDEVLRREEFISLMRELEREILRKKQSLLRDTLRMKECTHSEEEIQKIMKEFYSIAQRIQELTS